MSGHKIGDCREIKRTESVARLEEKNPRAEPKAEANGSLMSAAMTSTMVPW